MLPTHERFHSNEMKAVYINQRLVMHEKLGTLQTRSYITFEHELFESARGAARSVEVKIITALHLGAIQCDARRLQQSRRVATVLRIQADTDTARHEDLLIFEDECLLECMLDGARDVGGVLCPWNLCEQNDKFITTEARHCIAFANTTRETLGH